MCPASAVRQVLDAGQMVFEHGLAPDLARRTVSVCTRPHISKLPPQCHDMPKQLRQFGDTLSVSHGHRPMSTAKTRVIGQHSVPRTEIHRV